MNSTDTFRTLSSASEEILFKEKNSKFFGYAFPITSEEEVKPIIDHLRKKHFNAGHFCYAYQLGTTKRIYRANDDGEPSNSAGMPIFGQIQSFDLTNVLVVVVRFFGGTKLGVGGLISAYKTAAQMALEQAEIIEKTIDIHFQIHFDYKNINKVMRIIKEKNLTIISQKMDSNCEIEIATRKSNEKTVYGSFQNLFDVEVKIIE
ncbi:MAG: YigZ family protein [Flavobacterium sp.]|nr:YigZ family protein [Flavobacterium sp.]